MSEAGACCALASLTSMIGISRQAKMKAAWLGEIFQLKRTLGQGRLMELGSMLRRTFIRRKSSWDVGVRFEAPDRLPPAHGRKLGGCWSGSLRSSSPPGPASAEKLGLGAITDPKA